MIHVRVTIELPEDEVEFDYRPRLVQLVNLPGQARGLLMDAMRDAQAWLDARDPNLRQAQEETPR